LNDVHYICIASAQYIADYFHGGVTRESFERAPFVRFNQKDLLQHKFLQDHFDLKGDHIPHHIVPSTQAYIETIKAGLGYGMAPRTQVAQELESGQLIELAPGKQVSVLLYWHTWGVKTKLITDLSSQIISSASRL